MKRYPQPYWLLLLAILLFAELVVITNGQSFTEVFGGFAVWTFVLLVMALACLLTFYLCRWHGVRRTFFVFGCIALVVTLFYAEEDVRGWHAWYKFQQQAMAAGEKLDFASVIPPPVPANQNFALSPIVVSSYAAQLDTNGRAISPPLTNVVNRLAMNIYRNQDWPHSTTNGYWPQGTVTDLKAWQHYFATPPTNSVTNEFPVPSQPPSAAAAVLFGLGNFDAAIEELRAAAQLPQSRFPINYDAQPPYSALIPHLSPLKRCCQVLQLRALAELETGHPDQAVADIQLAFRVMDATRSEPLLISHLVRLAQFSLTLQPIFEGLARHQWSATQLMALETSLARQDFLADCQLALRSERNAALTTIDYLRQKTSDSKFMTVLIEPPILLDDENEGGINWTVILATTCYELAPAGWYWLNQSFIGELYQQWDLRICDPEKQLVSPALAKQADEALESELVSWRPWNCFATFLMPAVTASEIKFAFAQNAVDLARIACALERYRLANGTYPDSLFQLSPQFIAALPHDLITGQPLNYRLTHDGRFLLYSVGWNEVDDGGKVGLKSSGYFDIKTGDWLWQYPKI